MRQIITLKFLLVALATVVLSGATLFVYNSLSGSSAKESVVRRIDKGALITAAAPDESWRIANGKTRGTMVLTLNDETVANIGSRTPGLNSCKELLPNKCVLLADMLGPAVVWFAIVDANDSGSGTSLTMSGLVDMEENGDIGVLKNGWRVPLATPTIRNCDVTTTTLRDFINRYSDDKSISSFNLKTDQIESVTCKKK